MLRALERPLWVPLAAAAQKKPGARFLRKARVVLGPRGQLQVQLLAGVRCPGTTVQIESWTAPMRPSSRNPETSTELIAQATFRARAMWP